MTTTEMKSSMTSEQSTKSAPVAAPPSTTTTTTPSNDASNKPGPTGKLSLSELTRDEDELVAKAKELLAEREDKLREKKELLVLRMVATDLLGGTWDRKSAKTVMDALIEHYSDS